MKSTRRSLLKGALVGLAGLPLFKGTLARAENSKKCAKAPGGVKALDFKSKTAQRVDFVAVAKDSKHKKFKAGSNCGNCNWYKKPKEGWGKCAMVGNKYVPECGWCNKYKESKKKA